MFLAAALVLSYLVGSIPTSVWVGKAFYGIDVREHGSGNAGATNVYRVLGGKAGLFVMLFDAFKGWLAAGPIALLGTIDTWSPFGTGYFTYADGPAMVTLRLACGVLAILGHSFPVFAGFRGGKGVATTAGVLLAITPGALGLTFLVFALVAALTRHVALGSLLAAVTYPATLFVQRFVLGHDVPTGLLMVGTAMGAWIFWTHRGNITRLRRGEESRLEFGKRVQGMDAGTPFPSPSARPASTDASPSPVVAADPPTAP